MKPILALISLLFLVACSTTSSQDNFTCAQEIVPMELGVLSMLTGAPTRVNSKNSRLTGKEQPSSEWRYFGGPMGR